ncbi:MAG: hypothetical protein KBF98_00910 [Rhodoferax sp.]|nr:hypothetical protein [Rhodoferax sp.]
MRETRLLDWASPNLAHTAHPRKDHLIALMLAVGTWLGDLSILPKPQRN